MVALIEYWTPVTVFDAGRKAGWIKCDRATFYRDSIVEFAHESSIAPRLHAEYKWDGRTVNVSHRDIQVLAGMDDLHVSDVEMRGSVYFCFPKHPSWCPLDTEVRTALVTVGRDIGTDEPLLMTWVDTGVRGLGDDPELLHLHVSRNKRVGPAIEEASESPHCSLTDAEVCVPREVLKVVVGKLLVSEYKTHK